MAIALLLSILPLFSVTPHAYRLPIGGDIMTIETDWDTTLRNNFVTWSKVELRWQIVLTACNFSFFISTFHSSIRRLLWLLCVPWYNPSISVSCTGSLLLFAFVHCVICFCFPSVQSSCCPHPRSSCALNLSRLFSQITYSVCITLLSFHHQHILLSISVVFPHSIFLGFLHIILFIGLWSLYCSALLLLVPWLMQWMIYKSFTAYTWCRLSGSILHGFFLL